MHLKLFYIFFEKNMYI